jgi:hypothetical protein
VACGFDSEDRFGSFYLVTCLQEITEVRGTEEIRKKVKNVNRIGTRTKS